MSKWTPQLIPESKSHSCLNPIQKLINLSTALHLAIRGNVDYDIVRILLDNGADLESLNIRKQTPLHSFFNPLVSAVARQHTSSFEILSADARGMSLAHYFSWTNSSVPADFQHLLGVVSFLHRPDAEGRTPLHLAAQRGNKVVLDYLLTQTTSPPNTLLDKGGNTLLHHAVLSIRAPDTIRLLLSQDFCLESRNVQGHTPLQHAACWGTTKAVSFLLDLDPEGITAQDARGNNLLALARLVENKKVEMMLVARYGELLWNNGPLISRDRQSQLKSSRRKPREIYSIVCVSITLLGLALLMYRRPTWLSRTYLQTQMVAYCFWIRTVARYWISHGNHIASK